MLPINKSTQNSYFDWGEQSFRKKNNGNNKDFIHHPFFKTEKQQHKRLNFTFCLTDWEINCMLNHFYVLYYSVGQTYR